MKSTRSYTMGARARAVEHTRLRIMQAALQLSETRALAEITLDDVAASAEVSVQTVLRRFGSRAGLLEQTSAYAREVVVTEREAPVGDPPRALGVLMDHYERRGDSVLLLLEQDRTDPLVRAITDQGRDLHRAWLQRVFAPYLAGHPDADGLLDRLVVTTDVYAWKLLRRDRGLSRERTQAQLLRLCHSVLADATCDATSDPDPTTKDDTDG